MLPSISFLLVLCPLAVLAVPSALPLELDKRSITCLKVGQMAAATWKNSAGKTCTFRGVVGSNFGADAEGKGDYSCMGRCGAGCSGRALVGNVYTQDCFTHDVCSYFNNARGGAIDANCGREYRASIDDTALGAWRCRQNNPSFVVYKPTTEPICT
ncbi:hypothetical protein LY78DRAFT_402951 [Colletotrichum sublineola]|uniref:DUF8213 domain-containing protein n=1 Tax=Colletotrichum sublineola TaxID=1173701 RepID=A0A066XAV0_COLSU|nr:hypothetical protein LY78DRAFT_402951 [Colletotrichum sublineola]KDN62886.1 hypothetical protein CSUB01_11606 [Colletotrichum sublineola]